MGNMNNVGNVGWLDITVEGAPALRDFYATVVADPVGAVTALFQEP